MVVSRRVELMTAFRYRYHIQARDTTWAESCLKSSDPLCLPMLPSTIRYTHYQQQMSNVNATASSSKRPQGGPGGSHGAGKGKAKAATGAVKSKVKSNQVKRQQADEELKDLQARIDNFVCQILSSKRFISADLLFLDAF